MSNAVADLKHKLDHALSRAIADLAEQTERCRETEDRANDVLAKLKARWQRRTELMRGRSNTEGAGRHLDQI